jgi:hypothetical protein
VYLGAPYAFYKIFLLIKKKNIIPSLINLHLSKKK